MNSENFASTDLLGNKRKIHIENYKKVQVDEISI